MNNVQILFKQALAPILFLLVLVVYGLILRPQFLGQDSLPLEIIFILGAIVAIGQLVWMGHKWTDIQDSIVKKLAGAMPAWFILFTIGILISSWIICGTIPMLVYYGIKIIHPSFLYLFAFLVPIIFSTMTGTSWGSIGTIGVVVLGIATVLGAHLGITVGAIVGGAYFGDKMSPLSDTTNIAAMATDVDLYDHIHSMTYTTAPSAIIAAILYGILGFIYPPQSQNLDTPTTLEFLNGIESIFSFHLLLLIPPLVVLIGSLQKRPTLPVMFASIGSATLLVIPFQKFGLNDIVASLHKGFHTDMAPWASDIPGEVMELVNRGGLYYLAEPIITAMIIFIFIGALDHVNAMPIVIDHVFGFAKSRSATILSSLGATAFTSAMTSNQYATSFIVGDAFKSKFDQLKIPRKVLSRSLEDTGTMLESIVPWHPTALFIVATLGLPVADYWQWQFLSLINFMIAPALAITGIGCFYNEKNSL
jgi:NhaC family Na+:H+ antiporter